MILLIFGGIFFFVGLIITVAFAALAGLFSGRYILFPLAFMLCGLGVLIYAFILIKRKKE